MCGIFGFIGDNTSLIEETKDNILQLLYHRGPDTRGFVTLPKACLGHTCLAIHDDPYLSRQPMCDGSRSVYIVYNGEIYNFAYLKELLKKDGIIFKTNTDTEVLLNGYLRWGIGGLLDKIKGMFAFIIYDKRENKVFVARDPLGIKFLYFLNIKNEYVFSSEVKPLLCVADKLGTTVQPDILRLSLNLFYTRDMTGDRSLFRGVTNVLPGELITLDIKGDILFDRVIHSCAASYVSKELYDNFKSEGIEAVSGDLNNALTQSVEEHLLSNVDLGLLCSGGLDSSIIASLTAKQNKKRVRLLYLKNSGDTEGFEIVKHISRSSGVEFEPIQEESGFSLPGLPDLISGFETPCLRSDFFVNLMAKSARAKGIKVLLTGDGADELFGGYDVYRMILENQTKITSANGALQDIHLLDRLIYSTHTSQDKINSALDFILFGTHRYERWKRALSLFSHIDNPCERITHAYMFDNVSGNMVNKFLYRADRAGMLSSVEIRVPYLYETVARIALNLPLEFKLGSLIDKGSYSQENDDRKLLLKKVALRNGLPQGVVRRAKIGMMLSLDETIYKFSKLYNFDAIQEYFVASKKSIHDYIENSHSLAWSFLNVDIWLEIFARGTDPGHLKEEIIKISHNP